MAFDAGRYHNIADLRDGARRRLPKGIFEYVDRGTEDDIAVANNRQAYRRLEFAPRVLIDVSVRSTETTLFGTAATMPVAVAPTGFAGLCWHNGEIALAKAARAAGVPFTLSTLSISSLEDVAEQAGGRLWFQLNMWRKRSLSHDIVTRAEKAGYEALMLTVDNAAAPNREYNSRNGFTIPLKLRPRLMYDVATHPRWFTGVILRYLAREGMPKHMNYPEQYRDSIVRGINTTYDLRADNLTWDDVSELRRLWPRVLMVKGIQRADDARRCAERGVDCIVVSNHGGRNLDPSRAPLDVLPEVVDAVGDRTAVMTDGGVTRGSDIAKAVALGARGVLVGRSALYGVSVGGQAGAEHALSLLKTEFHRMMGYLGCRSVGEIDRDLVVAANA